MKRLLLTAALLGAPVAASAEIIVLTDQTTQLECTSPLGSCTQYYRVITFYDTFSGMYCIDQEKGLQCMLISKMTSGHYNQIKDLVEAEATESIGN